MGFYRVAKSKKHSGWSTDMFFEDTNKKYAARKNEDFNMIHCVPVLMELPKFNPISSEPTANKSPDSSNNNKINMVGSIDVDNIKH